MLTQYHGHTRNLQSIQAPSLQRANPRSYAEVPMLALDERSRLVDQVIRFAFETLGVRQLDVYVSGAELAAPTSARATMSITQS